LENPIKQFILEESVTEGYLSDWYQNLVTNDPPIWTDAHISEVYNDFYLIPREVVDNLKSPKTKRIYDLDPDGYEIFDVDLSISIANTEEEIYAYIRDHVIDEINEEYEDEDDLWSITMKDGEVLIYDHQMSVTEYWGMENAVEWLNEYSSGRYAYRPYKNIPDTK